MWEGVGPNTQSEQESTMNWEAGMRYPRVICAITVAALVMVVSVAQAAENMRYPDWKGQWTRWVPPNAVLDPGNNTYTAGGQPSHDQTRPWAHGQGAPLTSEYQKIFEDSVADQAAGGQGNFFNHGVRCMAGGMPMTMIAFQPLEFIVTPETTYILSDGQEPHRRIYTDGRDWPTGVDPTYAGYSIGRWIDDDGDGIYDVLEVETRGPFKGPRSYDASGLPLHFDNQSIFKERIFRDKADPKLMHDVMTVFDNALTRPWTVDKKYVRSPNPRPRWGESACIETNAMVAVGKDHYFLSGDGMLMPVRRNQPPPDLRYFKDWSK
jgi:hypothetical protein